MSYAVRDGVALITLDRPAALNAFTAPMHDAYRQCLAAAEADDEVVVIVVTGSGRAFCAGADLGGVRSAAEHGRYPAGAAQVAQRPGYGAHPDFDRAFLYHLGLRKPVVAAVNGIAVGLGVVLACCCDIRFAADDAEFRPNFARLGLPVEYGLTWMLDRLVGTSRTAELLLSGRALGATEAERIGLVARVCTRDRLVDEAVEYGATIAATCSPAALAAAKRQIYTDLLHGLAEAYDTSMALVDRMVKEDDFKEAVAALSERRAPAFRGGPRPADTDLAQPGKDQATARISVERAGRATTTQGANQ